MSEHGHHLNEDLKEGVEHAFGDYDHHGHHDVHGSIGKYLMVFLALCVLTGASFFTYSDLWPFKEQKAVTWAFMMAVSCTKAMLVIMFFMHLMWEANWKWVLTIPASGMSIFLLLMLVPDIGLRQDNIWAWYSRNRWLFAADRPAVQASDVHALEQQEGEVHPPDGQ